MWPPQGVWIILPCQFLHPKILPKPNLLGCYLCSHGLVILLCLPTTATNGSSHQTQQKSTKRPTRFRWNLGCRLHYLAPGIMLLSFVELCLAGTTKIFEASKLTFGCHWTAMCVQCIFIHFLSFFNSTSPQKNKFHNFTTSARDDHPWESKLLLFWHRHFAELVPGHLASHLFPKTTSGPAQKIKKKIFGRTIFWS